MLRRNVRYGGKVVFERNGLKVINKDRFKH